MLAIVTVGRWLLRAPRSTSSTRSGTGGLQHRHPHGHGVAVLARAFTRAWLGYRIGRAVGFAMFMAVIAQLVILASTAASYLAGIDSYFNHPAALNRTEARALRRRRWRSALSGLVVQHAAQRASPEPSAGRSAPCSRAPSAADVPRATAADLAA